MLRQIADKAYGPEQELDFFMVGDYPEIDIAGGKQEGMETILVESGIFDQSNHHDYEVYHKPFMHLVDHQTETVETAVDLVLKKYMC
mmetsp:Transcript_41813/g.63900  ORF Transcript_41813/g.63900 Transcript_41813/m.63900 type:complete len:87 (+) Transcript_41813:905-1165(+)